MYIVNTLFKLLFACLLLALIGILLIPYIPFLVVAFSL